MDTREVIIIGSGPAGLTAAIYTARANLHPLVIEGIGAGGQLMLTTDVENFPGFPDGILGPELMAQFREQAERFGAEFVTADVDRVDLAVRSRSGSGSATPSTRPTRSSSRPAPQARMLGLESEHELLGHGVSTCATCDGFFFRGHEIAVVGGGDSALEEANFLTRFADKVTLVHRRKELRASKIMQDRAFANPKIEFRWNSVVEDVKGDGRVEALRAARHRDRRDERARRSPACSSRSATTRTPQLFARPARPRRRRLHRHRSPDRRRPRSPACSRAATCRTTRTARRSPRPAPAAWPRSRPSATSRRSATAPIAG